MTTLFSPQTTAIIYGRKSVSIQRMLDFDYICGRKPSVACVVDPVSGSPERAFYGAREFLLPVVRTLKEGYQQYPEAEVLVNFASLRSAGDVVMEGIERGLRVVATIAEGVPERDARTWITKAKEKGTMLIGPATVGAVTAGAFRIGDTGGTVEHLLRSKLHRLGCVGYVGKSGGMSNEMYRIIAENSSGIVEGVAIGGDRYPGSLLLEHLLRFAQNPEISILVCLSELGGRDEEEIAQALQSGTIRKPLIVWVAGSSASHFPKEVQFGHAGAFAASTEETAEAKNMQLREAGAIVPGSFEGIGACIKEVYERLQKKGSITLPMEPHVPTIPEEHRHTHLQCTISSDQGNEPTYGGVPLTTFVEEGSLLRVVSRLWWKVDLPENVLSYLERALIAIADHGPAVAGAHNAIVAATAGKDSIASLCSGLLTIGPHFGGAIDTAARTFHDAFIRGLSPEAFIEEMKTKGERIPGIGHRIRSIHHPDSRVRALIAQARSVSKELPLTDYALAVEAITTKKKGNLILNVDGAIAVTVVDILFKHLPEEMRKDFFDVGYLNGLFALGRSIGILGHIFDQKRLKSPLYRHPEEDILYGEGALPST